MRDLAARTAAKTIERSGLTLAAQTLTTTRRYPFIALLLRRWQGKQARLTAISDFTRNAREARPSCTRSFPKAELSFAEDDALRNNLNRSMPRHALCSSRTRPVPRPPKMRWPLPISITAASDPTGRSSCGHQIATPSMKTPLVLRFCSRHAVTTDRWPARAYEEERKRADKRSTRSDRATPRPAFFPMSPRIFATPIRWMLGPLEDELARGYEPSAAGAGNESLETPPQPPCGALKCEHSMDFSRIEGAVWRPPMQPTDLEESIRRSCRASFAPQMEKESEIDASVDCSPCRSRTMLTGSEIGEKIVLKPLSKAC